MSPPDSDPTTRMATKKMKPPVMNPQARGRRSKRRGKVGERELAEVLREAGFAGARRGQQRSGLDQADVIGLPGWHVECKRTETLNVWRAFEQAARDAPAGEAPLVATRRDRSPWLVVLRLDRFLSLLPAPPTPGDSETGRTPEAQRVLDELLG